MSAPSLWSMGWTIIRCAQNALEAADRPQPMDTEVGAGGLDSVCCDGLFIDVTTGGRVDHRSGCTPIATAVLRLYLIRPCVPRGIDPEIPARAYDAGQPDAGTDINTWTPPSGTWHAGQYDALADLDALLPALANISAPNRDGLPFAGPIALLDHWAPYLTGPQGTCQGWMLLYRPVVL